MSSESSFDIVTSLKLFCVALFGVLVGGTLGAVYLISVPVKEVTDLPEEIQPATRYVLKGRTGGGDAWKFKASELQGGKEQISFLETELNRWADTFSTNFPEEKPGYYLEPKKPVFRLEGEKLLVSAKAEGALGVWKKALTLSCEGDFVPDGNSLNIVPNKLFIGSFRIPGPLKEYVWKELSSVYTLDEEFQTLWSSIESANVQESQLVLTAKR